MVASLIPANTLLMEFDPEKIRVDAQAYQFRLGVDGRNGVSKQYRYADSEWGEKHKRPLIVHERLNGQVYVADGHHRLDFARRLHAQGKEPRTVQAYVFREADGYGVKDVRLIAAYENIARGRSDILETAHVLKEAQAPGLHRAWLPGLQMDKSEMQIAYTISGLSERALDIILEGEISNETAARAATQFRAPEIQEGFLGIVANDIRLKKSFTQQVLDERAQQSGLGRN